MAYEQALGNDYKSLANTIGSTAQAAAVVVSDPALPEVTCHVLRLNKVTAGKNPGPACGKVKYSAADKRKGIGLHLVTKPLRVVVLARQHPEAAIGLAVGIVGAIWGIGYVMGRK